ncbi:MAG: hypothetical protein JO288_20370 [Hyphomicrobiales bacterium]|nr:hypothetical protein [Hyphomicrobiales bacterium]
MMRSATFLGAAAAVGLWVAGAADAQTLRRHHHPLHPAGEAGRQIIVHAPESWLTAGPGAEVGTTNRYASDTINGTLGRMPGIDHTTVGLRGEDRLPTNFTVPGCCVP